MSPPMVSCPNCSAPIRPGSKTCRSCGEEIGSGPPAAAKGATVRVRPPSPEKPKPAPARSTAPAAEQQQTRRVAAQGADRTVKIQAEGFDEGRTIKVNRGGDRDREPHPPGFVDFKPSIGYLGDATNASVALFLYFPTVLFAGTGAKIWARVQNRSGQLIKSVSVGLQSNGLEGNRVETIDQIDPNAIVPILFDNLMPVGIGVFVLQCSIEFRVGKNRERMAGARTLWINARPEATGEPGGVHTETFAVNSGEGKIPDGSIRPKLLNEEAGAFKLEDKSKSVEDLFRFKMEESYHPVALAYPPSIPKEFLTSAVTGAVLKMSPTDTSMLPVHLVARGEFKIGRGRQQPQAPIWSDLVVWFMPRNPVNDEKTKSLGRLHVIGESNDSRITFKNAKAELEGFLDEQSLGVDPIPFSGRVASLTLSDYNLDVLRFPGLEAGKLNIRNLDAWEGKSREEPTMQGALTFRPVGRKLPFHDAVWVLSSASFGSDPTCNAIIHPQLATVQGCIYHCYGCFWLQNLVKNDKVRVNGQPALPDQIFPLSGNDHITLGGTEFSLEVSAE